MDEGFFERPILNSPYAYPDRHWELDDDGRRTRSSRSADILDATSVPEPDKQRRAGTLWFSKHLNFLVHRCHRRSTFFPSGFPVRLRCPDKLD